MRLFIKHTLTFFYCVLGFFIYLQLTACQSSDKQEKEKSVHIEFQASDVINPNEKGQPSPVNIRIYELKNTDTFSMSDYFTISEGTDAELLTETKQVHEVMIKPGEKRQLELTPASDALALGIVAAYRDINHADAMKTWLLPGKDERAWYLKWLPESSPSLQIGLESLAVTIKEVD